MPIARCANCLTRIAHTVKARGLRSPSMGLPVTPSDFWQGEHRSIGQLPNARESGKHRRTWRLSFLAAAEYRATPERSSGEKLQEMPAHCTPLSSFGCRLAGAGAPGKRGAQLEVKHVRPIA